VHADRHAVTLMDYDALIAIAVALGLGLLVGLEREWAGNHLAGIRTFPLLTVLGAVLALPFEALPWMAPAGLLAVAGVLVAGYYVRTTRTDRGAGLTTAAAALAMYGAGVALGVGRVELGLLVGGAVALLLHWKRPMHELVERIGENDMRAVARMVLIALVVLPVLPDEAYDPYGVVNPFEIWLVVVLICGISLAGYLAYRFLGRTAGTLVGGLLGGLISSTATTVSYARISANRPAAGRVAALVIMIASTIVFVRVFVELAVVAPGIVFDMLPQLAAMAGWMLLIALVMWWRVPAGDAVGQGDIDDPLQIKAAVVFGLLYVAVLLAVAITERHLGGEGLYVVAGLSGLTDMDAITLSTAQMVDKGRLDVGTGWRMILIGAMANLLFKGCAVALLGGRRAALHVGVAFGLSIAGGVALLLLWP